jgi:hypothetical protein
MKWRSLKMIELTYSIEELCGMADLNESLYELFVESAMGHTFHDQDDLIKAEELVRSQLIDKSQKINPKELLEAVQWAMEQAYSQACENGAYEALKTHIEDICYEHGMPWKYYRAGGEALQAWEAEGVKFRVSDAKLREICINQGDDLEEAFDDPDYYLTELLHDTIAPYNWHNFYPIGSRFCPLNWERLFSEHQEISYQINQKFLDHKNKLKSLIKLGVNLKYRRDRSIHESF